MLGSIAREAALVLVTALVGITVAGDAPYGHLVMFKDNCDKTTFFSIAEEHKAEVSDKIDNALCSSARVVLDKVDKKQEVLGKLKNNDCVELMKPVELRDQQSGSFHVVGDKPVDLDDEHSIDEPDNGSSEGSSNPQRREVKSRITIPQIMSEVNRLHAEGHTGEAVRIALIDSGVDYNHPALGNGCFGRPECVVDKGYDFVGDGFPNGPAVEKADPMDCSGHGTHVAGIIGAQPGMGNPHRFTGAAHGAKLRMYRVFGCGRGTNDNIVLKALDRAYRDQPDIISMSLGNNRSFAETILSKALTKVVAAGIPIFQSTGNYGEMGLFFPGSPAKGISGVASFQNRAFIQRVNMLNYTVDGGSRHSATVMLAEPAEWAGVSLPLWKVDACNLPANNLPDFSKHIVLMKYEKCGKNQPRQMVNLAAAGAKYVITYWEDDKGIIGYFFVRSQVLKQGSFLGLASVQSSVAARWDRELQQGRSVVVDMPSKDEEGGFFNAGPMGTPKDVLDDTSSWGPTWDMEINPHFGAPGGGILSTIPVKMGSYAVYSGTSMACPLAAAVLALVFRARGNMKLSPEQAQAIMSMTAKPARYYDHATWTQSPDMAPVAQQGSGLIQAYKAVHNPSIISPSSISFNDTDSFEAGPVTLYLDNTSRARVQYHVRHVPALTTYTLEKGSVRAMKLPNEFVSGVYASLDFSTADQIVEPGQRLEIQVTVTPPSGLDAARLPYWSGYIIVEGSDYSNLTVPHHGLGGSLRGATVLGSDGAWMSKSTDYDDKKPVPDGHKFSISQSGPSELPMLTFQVALATPRLHAYVVPDAAPGATVDVWGTKTLGEVEGFPYQWVDRTVNNVTWDGWLESGVMVPAGKYKIMVTALRLRSQGSDKADWDVSETDWFNIEYV